MHSRKKGKRKGNKLRNVHVIIHSKKEREKKLISDFIKLLIWEKKKSNSHIYKKKIYELSNFINLRICGGEKRTFQITTQMAHMKRVKTPFISLQILLIENNLVYFPF